MSAMTLNEVLKGRRSQPQQLVEVLQDVQDSKGYIPEGDMKVIAGELGVPQIEVFRVANFYKAFSLKPRGRNVLTVCAGTACHVRGANILANQVLGQLGIAPGETTEDGMFTLEQVNCLGACALGPVVVHNGEYHDHMTPGKLRKLINSVAEQEKEVVDAKAKGKTRGGAKSKAGNKKRKRSRGTAKKSSVAE